MELNRSFRGDLEIKEWIKPAENTVPDDLDLSVMAKSALNYLRGNPDPARNYECKFHLGPLGIPYHLPEIAPPNEYGYDPVSLGDTDCRMDWQYSHMREMAGEMEPEAYELGVRARIKGYQGPDHLVWINPAAYIGEPIEGTWATTWSSLKLLYSLSEEFLHTGDQAVAAECKAIFQSVKALAIWDGDRAWYPGICPIKDGVWLDKGWCESFKSSYAFIVEPCVRYWECTGDDEALEFAKAVTEGILAHSQPDMGAYRVDDETGYFEGHIHMHTHTIWGVAHLGTILNEQRYLDWAKKAHDFVLSVGTDYGWYPEFVPQVEYRTEICVVGDMVSVGAWLARGVSPSYWDVIERTVRNMLRHSQFFLTPEFVELFKTLHKQDLSEVVDKALDGMKKIEGGYVAQASFNDWVGYISDDIGKPGMYKNGIHMMGCCPPEGMRGLWEAWNGVVEEKPEGIYVNMSICRDHTAALVEASKPECGVLTVTAKKNAIYYLRPPAWVNRDDVGIMLNSASVPVRWGGPENAYVCINLSLGDKVRLSWSVPRFVQKYNPTSIPGKEYDLAVGWTGNKVDGVSPVGDYLPMFGPVVG